MLRVAMYIWLCSIVRGPGLATYVSPQSRCWRVASSRFGGLCFRQLGQFAAHFLVIGHSISKVDWPTNVTLTQCSIVVSITLRCRAPIFRLMWALAIFIIVVQR